MSTLNRIRSILFDSAQVLYGCPKGHRITTAQEKASPWRYLGKAIKHVFLHLLRRNPDEGYDIDAAGMPTAAMSGPRETNTPPW